MSESELSLGAWSAERFVLQSDLSLADRSLGERCSWALCPERIVRGRSVSERTVRIPLRICTPNTTIMLPGVCFIFRKNVIWKLFHQRREVHLHLHLLRIRYLGRGTENSYIASSLFKVGFANYLKIGPEYPGKICGVEVHIRERRDSGQHRW